MLSTQDETEVAPPSSWPPPLRTPVHLRGWSRYCDTRQPKEASNVEHKLRPVPARQSSTLLMSCLVPNPIQFTNEHEDYVPRVKAAICRATDVKTARFRIPVNRNGFLCDYLV